MNNRRKQRRARSRAIPWAFIVTILIVGLLGYGAVRGVGQVIEKWTSDLPSVTDSEALNLAQKTRIYAADKKTQLAEFYLENREPLSSLTQISAFIIDGTIDTEDIRYYEHDGVDMQGTARAIYTTLSGSGLEGGSTITQQFVRYTFLSAEANEISVKRKIREMQLAMDLEDVYSKEEILLMYLNTINYGDGCYGIEAAAQNYFQKSAKEVTLAEAATLAGIPQSPTNLNPKEYPDACLERRNLVLNRMLSAGDITQAQYDEAVALPLGLNPKPEAAEDGIYAYPYFTSYVRDLLVKQYSSAEVFKGGWTVYTTLQPDLQDKAESAAAAQRAVMADDLEVALTAIDPNTGYIVALVGGNPDTYYETQWNLATQAQRQCGSSFKAFTLVTAIEEGISPYTYVDCSSPYTLNDQRYENYGGATYGTQTIQKATAWSSNTGYLRLQQEVGSEKVVDVAHRMGVKSDLYAWDSLTLGVELVNTVEMASAYGTLATGGVQRDSVAVTEILDSDGNTFFKHTDTKTQALTEEVAYAATKVLETVLNESGATGTAARLASGQEAAGKTGTTENWRDSYFVGYTPQYSCAVWIGARQERTMPAWIDCTGVWRNFMTAALEGKELEKFKEAKAPTYDNPFTTKHGTGYDPNTSRSRSNSSDSSEDYDYDEYIYEYYDDGTGAGDAEIDAIIDEALGNDDQAARREDE